ncbi:hypothetical protein DPMN_056876 [Dreissena polymorpha]|uniref:Cystatin n=1 Tax=Dreissena polymorpha TaxID=45954 RepID=A0A9D4CTD3_DREPO|nr:hypothetical protein DPMN_056876 [Dreissena polymorpha]
MATKAAHTLWPDLFMDRVVKAESQVVAGTNYRMDILLYRIINDRVTWKQTVQVFEPLPGSN